LHSSKQATHLNASFANTFTRSKQLGAKNTELLAFLQSQKRAEQQPENAQPALGASQVFTSVTGSVKSQGAKARDE